MRRGLASGDWAPGLSDIDLLLEIQKLPVSGETGFLDRWHRMLRRLKRWLPFLGEVQIATRGELEAYLAHGDIRSRSFLKQCRPLLGRSPLPACPEGKAQAEDARETLKRRLDAWVECLHAFVRLAQDCFSPGDPPLRAAYTLRKCLLDILRYGELAVEGRSLPCEGRSEFWRHLRQDPGRNEPFARLLESLEEAETREQVQEASLQACALGARRLEILAGVIVPEILSHPRENQASSAPYPSFDAPGREQESHRKFFGEVARRLSGLVQEGFFDSLFHLYLVLPEDGGVEEALEACGILLVLKRRFGILEIPVLPLYPSSFQLLLWSSYLGDPLKFLQLTRPGWIGPKVYVDCAGKSDMLRLHLQAAWNLCSRWGTPPPAWLVQKVALECAAHLALNWRGLGSTYAPFSPLYRLIYLYGRMMGSRLLLECGEPCPFYPIEALASRYTLRFPGAKAWIEKSLLKAQQPAPFAAHLEFLCGEMGSLTRWLEAKGGLGRQPGLRIHRDEP